MTKSVRRKQTVDESTIEALYTDTQSLYHLDSISPTGGMAQLGEMPAASVGLLVALGTVWVLILAYCLCRWLRSRPRHPRGW